MSDCCANTGVLLYACSGGSNVGQIANEAAKALDQLKQGRMSCIIGVGARLDSFVAGARAATTVAIDGCEVACARKALENVGLAPDVHVIVTALGIEKGHHFEIATDQVAHVAGTAAEQLRCNCAKDGGACGCR